jgi:hypothetical protein
MERDFARSALEIGFDRAVQIIERFRRALEL